MTKTKRFKEVVKVSVKEVVQVCRGQTPPRHTVTEYGCLLKAHVLSSSLAWQTIATPFE